MNNETQLIQSNDVIELNDDKGEAVTLTAGRVLKTLSGGAKTFVSRKDLGEMTGYKGAQLKRLHAQLVNGYGGKLSSGLVGLINDRQLKTTKVKAAERKDGSTVYDVRFVTPAKAPEAKGRGETKSKAQIEQEAMAKALNVLAEKLGMDVATVQQLTNGEQAAA